MHNSDGPKNPTPVPWRYLSPKAEMNEQASTGASDGR